MTGRERWVQRTRESVLRALEREHGGPETAQSLEGNLDISTYMPSLGFVDQRTEREIAAALRWLAVQGWVEEAEREPYDPPGGKLYRLTPAGRDQCLVYAVFMTRRYAS